MEVYSAVYCTGGHLVALGEQLPGNAHARDVPACICLICAWSQTNCHVNAHHVLQVLTTSAGCSMAPMMQCLASPQCA